MATDFNRLRLKHHGDAQKLHEILQMECRHKCGKKLASTLGLCPGFEFPSVALAEMSTSDDVASLHADIIDEPCSILDMTAGLGIDSFHFARKGCRVTAIEIFHDAAEALLHNVRAMGLEDMVTVIEGDSVKWLEDSDAVFDTIFIDPARRDSSGRHFSFNQCAPDLTAIMPLLLSRCSRLIVKASPMLDISSALKELCVKSCDVITIGTTKECKEIVLDICADTVHDDATGVRISCHTVGGYAPYSISTGNDGCQPGYMNPEPGGFLMQPFPAVMKGTGGIVNGYSKLHPFTHLYYSDTFSDSFPGTSFPIIEVVPFNKASVKSFRNDYPKINVASRNFPLSAPELAKKLRIAEGGEEMVFGVTLDDGSRALIVTGPGVNPVR